MKCGGNWLSNEVPIRDCISDVSPSFTSLLTPHRHEVSTSFLIITNDHSAVIAADRPFDSLAARSADVGFFYFDTRRCTPERIRAPAPRSTDEANTSRALISCLTHRRASALTHAACRMNRRAAEISGMTFS